MLGTQPAALQHCAWSLVTRVPLGSPLGGPLCRWPCYHRWITWGMCQEALDLERSNGGEMTEGIARKIKIMICGTGLDLLQSSGEFPCAVCHTGVGSNSIFCDGCKHWVHKKCSGLKCLTKDPDYRRTWCQGTARPLDGRPQRDVQVGPEKLEVVDSFSYIKVMPSEAASCELSTTCENCLEEVQGAATSFLFLPPLFQDMWPHV